MTFDELIYQRFSSLDFFKEKLAAYCGKPAVFYQIAPGDEHEGWDGKQYPRIVYTIDMQADTERKTAGIMQVELFCDETETMPEDIEPFIRQSLQNLIMKPSGSSCYAFAWSRTEMFSLTGRERDRGVPVRIAGASLRFDILEYSDQFMTFPDPAESLSLGLKEVYKDLFVIGIDKISDFYEVTEDNPAVFVRVESYENDHTSMALAWINCRLAIHVIAPEVDARSKWVRVLANCLMLSGEAVMTDGTPLRFTGIQATHTSDYLASGQIVLSAQYTLPRPQREASVPMNAVVKEAQNGN